MKELILPGSVNTLLLLLPVGISEHLNFKLHYDTIMMNFTVVINADQKSKINLFWRATCCLINCVQSTKELFIYP